MVTIDEVVLAVNYALDGEAQRRPRRGGGDARADEGVTRVDRKGLDPFVAAAKKHRIWQREPQVRTPG